MLSLWRVSLLLCLGQLLHCAEAQVHTEVQAGPLYRVLGTPLYISCNVSGFRSENTDKHFEIRMKRPSKPDIEIQIISSSDPNFGYSSYQSRVRKNEIALKRLSPNSVRFEIQSLQESDEGEYECTVINSEGSYHGTYTGITVVKVIEDSLSISSPTRISRSFNEGEALSLTCLASSSTSQHTHLSLAWFLRKDGEDSAQPIISLDRDFTLSPGQRFEGRYQARLIRLDKLGETEYSLEIAELEPSDQGKIYCRAQEWIQDPDGSWYTITEKSAEEMTLTVKATEVVEPSSPSLAVRISAQPATLQEGQELLLSCNINTQDVEKRFFSVAWLKGTAELARIGPTGVLSVAPKYSYREKNGELRATRTGNRDYHLILKPVRTEDQGEYICRASLQDRGQDDAFIQGEAKDSSPQLVSISATENRLSVKMQQAVNVNEGDGLQLACKVDGVQGQLSVTWKRKLSTRTSFTDVISLNQEGVTQKAEAFVSRKVRAMRPTADNFTLELDEVTLSDSGVYQCVVSEWKSNSKTHRQPQTATVTVIPIDQLMGVSLMSRKSLVTVGENVELMCRVKGPRMPVTLTWSVQHNVSAPDTILTLHPDGTIHWSADQNHYQLRVESRDKEVIYYLIIFGTSHSEGGNYQCNVSIFLENEHKEGPASNPLTVMVKNRESSLIVSSSPELTQNINTDITMKCSITKETSASSLYSITWLLQRRTENEILVSSDRNSLVTFGPRVGQSQTRISMRRSNGPAFELTIRQAKISDKGLYICKVEEWLQDPRGKWYQLSTVSKSTMLTVTEPANNLHLDEKEQELITREGEEVELNCNITSGASGSSVFYRVLWHYATQSSSLKNASLVELDHTGRVNYPENQEVRGLQGRLRLSRPTQRSFYLSIQQAHEEDSGIYWCQVEQYQLDNEARWQLKASDTGGAIKLSVNVTENNLSIPKEGAELNITRNQDFTIPCNINKQSSLESKFQVTWFWQKETETKQRPIYTVYRNSTLQDRFGENVHLRFGHPDPRQFSLTFLKPGPENSGLYFCEVEEWLPSLSHGWRKVAVEKSGNLTVSVITEGDAKAISECNSSTYIIIIVVVLIILALVILLLMLKICRVKGSEEKKAASLWVESHPLNTKPSEED